MLNSSMQEEEYKAVWLSHSSISDFLACPRAYYLKNVYKDPKTGNKVQIVTPALTLGSIVHQVVESLSVLPLSSRFKTPLVEKFNSLWSKVSGKPGGFIDPKTETKYKTRGQDMLTMVEIHPGPVERLAVKIQMDLPHYWLSQTDNLILCGKVDWIEYLKANDSLHIIDFKTSQNEELIDSLQLPIYQLIVANCQPRKIQKASYWYLEKGPQLTLKDLPEPVSTTKKILEIGKKIKLARSLQHFPCPEGETGCRCCQPFEAIINGQAEFVGTSDFRDNYIITASKFEDKIDSIVL